MDARLAINSLSVPDAPAPASDGANCHRMDPGIEHEVRVLWENGVDTVESCQGGSGHAFAVPTVRFRGNAEEGRRALGIAVRHGLVVDELRRCASGQGDPAQGPCWEMTFRR
jgi:hypothetical protein